MDELASRTFRSRTLAGSAALGLLFLSTGGCFCTYGVWGWAVQPVRRSRAVGVTGSPESGEKVVFSLRECPDRPDGQYTFDIPAGWQDMSTRASVWGSSVQEIAQPVTSLVPAEESIARGGTRRLATLDFHSLARGSGSGRRPEYGVIYVPGEDRYAAEVFGYDAERSRWVLLGGVPLDPGRESAARVGLAIFVTPITLGFDPSAVMLVYGSYPYGSCSPPRYMFALRRLIKQLNDPEPKPRIAAARRLREYGLRGKPAAPALRRMLADRDPSVSREALWTLCAIDALDASTLSDLRLRRDLALRRDAAIFLAEARGRK